VLAQVKARAVQAEFGALISRLRHNPKDRSLGVEPLRDSYPNAYLVEFDRAVLIFQVLLDHPVIELLQVTWLEDFKPD
jgi:hypothetical protein